MWKYEKIFVKSYTPDWPIEAFAIKIVKSTLP